MYHQSSRNNSDHSDHFLLYQLDWENNESTLLEASGMLREGLSSERAPMSPLVWALQMLAQQQQKEGRIRLHLDVDYNGTSLAIRMCPGGRACRAVDVNRTHVARLLGGSLSPRELEIAMEMFEGNTIRYIAQRFQIAEGTVKRTMHNIYRKLDIASQVDLVREIYARAYREFES